MKDIVKYVQDKTLEDESMRDKINLLAEYFRM